MNVKAIYRVVFIILIILLALLVIMIGGGPRQAMAMGGGAARGHGTGILFHGSPEAAATVEPTTPEGEISATSSRWMALMAAAPAKAAEGLEFGYIAATPYIAEKKKGALSILKTPGYIHIISAKGFSGRQVPGQRHLFAKTGPARVLESEPIPNIYEDLNRFSNVQLITSADREKFLAEKTKEHETFIAERGTSPSPAAAAAAAALAPEATAAAVAAGETLSDY